MRPIKQSLFVITFLLLVLTGCKKEKIFNVQNEQEMSSNYKFSYVEGDMVLGKKLNNPYSISNMTEAYNNLAAQKIFSLITPDIRVTHYYIKFTPANIDEYELLKANKNLTLYDYPLDYEIVQGGNRYHDKSLPIETPTYQYGVIKVGKTIPNASNYEVLSELYIPEEDTLLFGSNFVNYEYIDLLLDQAYIQTSNFLDTVKYFQENRASRYTPGGKILINDIRLNSNIGLEGVEMRARRWFTTLKARPNYNGNYRMSGSFNRPCNYSLQFDQVHFTVREHLLGLTAWINGPKITGDWNYTIANGYDRFVGHIFRGAYRYHYQFIDGLQSPIRPSGNRTIYIGKDCAKNWSGINYIVFPILKIARYSSGNLEFASDEVFSATIHETAHTSHVIKMNAGAIQYSQVAPIIQESWPVGIEWWLTKFEYKNTRGVSNYGDWNYSVYVGFPHYYAYQYWNKNDNSHDYTNLFINLVDSYNDTNMWPASGVANDNVSGYTFASIEANVLKHSYGLTSLKTELKQYKPYGVSDSQIDQLINYY